jgi:VIT1/CCC1 family predicted Fe2+/Mn2+ transporter
MDGQIKKGIHFGLTSAIITTLGLLVGLYSSTKSVLAVIGGIVVIAVADALSDALGMHISEEGEAKHTARGIWEATVFTLLSKFIFATTFAVPVLLFELSTAVMICVLWGLLLITIVSYVIAKETKQNPSLVIAEHVLISVLVVVISYLVGLWVSAFV